MDEYARFVTAIFFTMGPGGMVKPATALYKPIASMLSEKTSESYSSTIDWYVVGLDLLGCALQCVSFLPIPLPGSI